MPFDVEKIECGRILNWSFAHRCVGILYLYSISFFCVQAYLWLISMFLFVLLSSSDAFRFLLMLGFLFISLPDLDISVHIYMCLCVWNPGKFNNFEWRKYFMLKRLSLFVDLYWNSCCQWRLLSLLIVVVNFFLSSHSVSTISFDAFCCWI